MATWEAGSAHVAYTGSGTSRETSRARLMASRLDAIPISIIIKPKFLGAVSRTEHLPSTPTYTVRLINPTSGRGL